VRYHGVFAPHAGLRSRVVPVAPKLSRAPSSPAKLPVPSPRQQANPDPTYPCCEPTASRGPTCSPGLRHRRPRCPQCDGRHRLIAFIPDSRAAQRILDHLGVDATGPPAAPPRTIAEELKSAPDHDLVDPVYEG
jgi:hypothetical protein